VEVPFTIENRGSREPIEQLIFVINKRKSEIPHQLVKVILDSDKDQHVHVEK
jgi:hypothetical protein